MGQPLAWLRLRWLLVRLVNRTRRTVPKHPGMHRRQWSPLDLQSDNTHLIELERILLAEKLDHLKCLSRDAVGSLVHIDFSQFLM